MKTLTALDSLERRAWRSVHQDGLLDMYLGLVLIAWAVAMILGRMGMGETATTVLYAALLFGGIALLWIGKRRITTPRIGVAQFGHERRVRRVKGTIVLAGSALLGLAVWLLFAIGPDAVRTVGWPPYLFFANAIVVFGFLGYFLDLPRLYAYGFFFGLPILVRELLGGRGNGDPAIVLFLAFGAAALAIGAALLARFVHRYPPTKAEDS